MRVKLKNIYFQIITKCQMKHLSNKIWRKKLMDFQIQFYLICFNIIELIHINRYLNAKHKTYTVSIVTMIQYNKQ